MASLIAPTQGVSSSTPRTNLGDTVRVPLAPIAGFCIKSLTTEPGFYTFVDAPSPPASSSSSSQAKQNLSEPASRNTARTLQISVGTKVFLNIAWDRRVPGPPEANEEVVRRAMAGMDLDDDGREGGGYYVPVIVSEPREDSDKVRSSCLPSLLPDA